MPPSPEPPEAAAPSILDEYVTSAPSPQNAIDLFTGEWSSQLPPPLQDIQAGPLPLFDDARVTWAIDSFGGVAGSRILELGPLEGGHTYQLHAAGAEIIAVEAQTRAYLKCLIVKELLGMPQARFLLGDFTPYLRDAEERFDLCFASGVLYHMRNPVETIALTAKVATKLFLWTHVYDEDVITRSELLAPRFPSHQRATHQGFDHTLHRFNYAEALQRNGFCGGSAPYSNWLTRADLLAALEHFGWTVTNIGFDTPDHPHGPALALTATRIDTEA
ncbi:class I SAM-dependent methyltransferase [Saccharopolyspora hattusasensis]|uniref:class I SAM-dependent methyltransferase n=1 Tax=Saccharopolyspora hattusasensis TaxID=1128679 RepID=UPI003D98A81B